MLPLTDTGEDTDDLFPTKVPLPRTRIMTFSLSSSISACLTVCLLTPWISQSCFSVRKRSLGFSPFDVMYSFTQSTIIRYL